MESFEKRNSSATKAEEILASHVAEEAEYERHLDGASQNPENWPSMYTYVDGRWMENYRSGYTPGNSLMGQALGRAKHGVLKMVKGGVESYHRRKLDHLRKPDEIRAEGREQIEALMDETAKDHINYKITELLAALSEEKSTYNQKRIEKEIDQLKAYTGLE